jgi:hypothetical protein
MSNQQIDRNKEECLSILKGYILASHVQLIDFEVNTPVQETISTKEGYKQFGHTGDIYITIHLFNKGGIR